jgi:hypothetical protein
LYPPKLVQKWITAENVNDICKENGFNGDIDFFSLDMDGIDYWIWKALETIKPRVFMCEFSDIFEAGKSVTVPYKPDFNRLDTHPDFHSASLSAFVKLSKEKGYRLIGCNKLSFNAIFLRNDVGTDVFPEVKAEDCLNNAYVIEQINKRQQKIINLPWIEV